MHKDVAFKLADALESGKYKQGDGQLKKGSKFCCLGVLCDISGLGKWKKPSKQTAFGAEYVVDEYDYSDLQLPRAVLEWAGMTNSSGAYTSVAGQKSLADYNDGERYFEDGLDKQKAPKTFKEIAAFIRKYYKAL